MPLPSPNLNTLVMVGGGKRRAMEKAETPTLCLRHFGVTSSRRLNFSTASSNLIEIFPRPGGGGGYSECFGFFRLHYSHPKNPNGHPLPLDILNTFTLTSLEQRDAGIPETQWLKPVFDDDKENYPGPSTRKRKTNNAGGTNVKKARKSA
ncbi:hypothetical protein EDB19DRAFT_1825551 [Suillus lakei]|nr:hypothetical protein EDB19DRAFT_1825551 [Suillus lakei]